MRLCSDNVNHNGLTPPSHALGSLLARTQRTHRASETWRDQTGWPYRAPADARTDQPAWHVGPSGSPTGPLETCQADQPTTRPPCRSHAGPQPSSRDQTQDVYRDPWHLRPPRPHRSPQLPIRAAQRPHEAHGVDCGSFVRRWRRGDTRLHVWASWG